MPKPIQAPWGLLAEAQRAWDAAAEAVGERLVRERAAVDRYARAVDAAARLRKEWEAAGHPVLGTGSQGQAIAHPLLKAMTDAEDAAARHGAALGLDELAATKILTRGQGTPRRGSHLVTPEAPSAKLRQVK